MFVSQNGIDLIKHFEGVRLSCYHLGDGVCTIGFGTTRPLSQCPREGSWTITMSQAESMLRSNLRNAENIVNTYFRNLNQNQFDALISFVHNCGAPFKNDGWDTAAMQAPNVEYITSSMLNYVNPPQFTAGLLRRRLAEVELFKKPTTQQSNNQTTTNRKGIKNMFAVQVQGRPERYIVTPNRVIHATPALWSAFRKGTGLSAEVITQEELEALRGTFR